MRKKELPKLNDDQKKMIEQNENLAYYIMKNKLIRKNEIYPEDWKEIAHDALYRCAIRFDPSKNCNFGTLLKWCLKTEIYKKKRYNIKNGLAKAPVKLKKTVVINFTDYSQNFSKKHCNKKAGKSEYDQTEKKDVKNFWNEIKTLITEKEFNIIYSRYAKKMSMIDIASKFGYSSQFGVKNALSACMKKLRNYKNQIKEIAFQKIW